MDIELFDKRYVYLEWSDELEGKDCILAKSYKDLKDFVNSGDEDRFCKANKGKEKPFTNLWSECDFCYYDPNLKVKKAWLDGKTIQKCVLNEWEDLNLVETCNIENYLDNEDWDEYEWRIKPTEIFYVIFEKTMFETVKVLSMSPCFTNRFYFKGTQEECDKWIDEHKLYAEILSAWKDGKIIQYKIETNDNWSDWILKEYPKTNWLEMCDWRIKPEHEYNIIYQPTEPKYYLSVNKNGHLEFAISQDIKDGAIYNGTRKECERMLKIIGNEFEDCSYCTSEGVFCYHCGKLHNIINKYSHEKYKRRMTNRELSEWLAEGNGEFKNVGYLINTSTSYWYQDGAENKNVDDNILIRDFGSDEWREPLIEV